MMVMKKKMKYKFIVFLYTYLRQVDLSLDRSRWTTIEELRNYYANQINPKMISDYICQDIECNITSSFYIEKQKTFLNRIKNYFLKIFGKNTFLSSEEICYCSDKLLALHKYLTCDFEIDKEEIERLRIEIAKFNYNIIVSKLYSTDKNKAMFVEHFMQNENLETIEIRSFLKDLDLDHFIVFS